MCTVYTRTVVSTELAALIGNRKLVVNIQVGLLFIYTVRQFYLNNCRNEIRQQLFPHNKDMTQDKASIRLQNVVWI